MSLSAADVLAIEASFAAQTDGNGVIDQTGANQIWMLIAGFLVFFMHAGFSMLEAGSVQKPNVVNIMFKNIATISIAAIVYWAFGWAFAYGSRKCNGGPSNLFIGSTAFFYNILDNRGCTNDEALVFFQFAFAATAATIVSGAVAGRINLVAYFVVAFFISGLIYPIVTHWVWSSDGFLSAFNGDYLLIDGSIGLIDFAGSGVVHATGGVAALVGAFVVGPRQGRFVDGVAVPLEPSSYVLQTLGVFILWFGWYGFNCGSTLAFDGVNISKVAVTTTISASSACVTSIVLGRVLTGRYDLPMALNSILAGLVSITAGCVAVWDGWALLIGAVGAVVYIASSELILRLGIDDPIGASPVHGFAGIWGVLAAGIFADSAAVSNGYSGAVLDRGPQIVAQVVGIVIIVGWVAVTSAILFMSLTCCQFSKRTKFLRVPPEVEEAGLDDSEHGGKFDVHF